MTSGTDAKWDQGSRLSILGVKNDNRSFIVAKQVTKNCNREPTESMMAGWIRGIWKRDQHFDRMSGCGSRVTKDKIERMIDARYVKILQVRVHKMKYWEKEKTGLWVAKDKIKQKIDFEFKVLQMLREDTDQGELMLASAARNKTTNWKEQRRKFLTAAINHTWQTIKHYAKSLKERKWENYGKERELSCSWRRKTAL